jgi:hypothetical protein
MTSETEVHLHPATLEQFKHGLEKSDELLIPGDFQNLKGSNWNPQLGVLQALAQVEDFLASLGIKSAALQRLERAFAVFAQEMEAIDRRFGKPQADERRECLNALKAVSNFLQDTRGWQSLALNRMHAELENKLAKGGANTRIMNMSQALFAAALDRKMAENRERRKAGFDAGINEEAAAKWVSAQIAKRSKPKITVDYTKLISWRDKFRRGHTGPGSHYYKDMIAVAAADPLPMQVEYLLRAAITMHVSGRPYPERAGKKRHQKGNV